MLVICNQSLTTQEISKNRKNAKKVSDIFLPDPVFLPKRVLFQRLALQVVIIVQVARALNSDFAKVRSRIQHLADLRFFPIAPRFCTLRMWSGAKGTWQSLFPRSAVTGPIFSPIWSANSVRGRT